MRAALQFNFNFNTVRVLVVMEQESIWVSFQAKFQGLILLQLQCLLLRSCNRSRVARSTTIKMQCVRQEPSDIPETLLLSPERSIRKLLFARHQCSDSGYQSFRSICTKELLFKYQTQALQQSPHYKVDSSSSALFHSGSDLRFFFCEASVFPFTVQFFSVYSTNEDRRCDDH